MDKDSIKQINDELRGLLKENGCEGAANYIDYWEKSIPSLSDDLKNEIFLKIKNSIINDQSKQYGFKIFDYRIFKYGLIGIAALFFLVIVFTLNPFLKKSGNFNDDINNISVTSVYNPSIHCSFVIGDAVVIKNGKYKKITKGMFFNSDDLIICKANSLVELSYKNNTIKIGNNTKFKINSLFKNNKLNFNANLYNGKVITKIKKLEKDENFTIKTDTAVAAVRGTKFLLAVNKDSTTLKVVEGKVAIIPNVKTIDKSALALNFAIIVDKGQKVEIKTSDLKVINKKTSRFKNKKFSNKIKQIINEQIKVQKLSKDEVKHIEQYDNYKMTLNIEDKDLYGISIDDLVNIKRVFQNDKGLVLLDDKKIYYSNSKTIDWYIDKKAENILLHKKLIIVPSLNKVFAYNIDGEQKWDLILNNNIDEEKTAILSNYLIIPDVMGNLYFVDILNGKIKKQVVLDSSLKTVPVKLKNLICVVTKKGELNAIDLNLGITIFKKEVGNIIEDGFIAAYPYIYIANSSMVKKIDFMMDEVQWNWIGENINKIIVIKDRTYILDNEKNIVCIGKNGEKLWEINSGDKIDDIIKVDNYLVYMSSNYLYKINEKGKVLWSFNTGPKPRIIGYNQKKIFILLNNKFKPINL